MSFLSAGTAQRLNLLLAVQSAQDVTHSPTINLEGGFNMLGSLTPETLRDQRSRAVAQLIKHGSWECPIQGYEQGVMRLERLLNYLRRLERRCAEGESEDDLIAMAISEDAAFSWPTDTFIQTLTQTLLVPEEGDWNAAPQDMISDFTRDLHNIVVIAHGSEDSRMSSGMPA